MALFHNVVLEFGKNLQRDHRKGTSGKAVVTSNKNLGMIESKLLFCENCETQLYIYESRCGCHLASKKVVDYDCY